MKSRPGYGDVVWVPFESYMEPGGVHSVCMNDAYGTPRRFVLNLLLTHMRVIKGAPLIRGVVVMPARWASNVRFPSGDEIAIKNADLWSPREATEDAECQTP